MFYGLKTILPLKQQLPLKQLSENWILPVDRKNSYQKFLSTMLSEMLVDVAVLSQPRTIFLHKHHHRGFEHKDYRNKLWMESVEQSVAYFDFFFDFLLPEAEGFDPAYLLSICLIKSFAASCLDFWFRRIIAWRLSSPALLFISCFAFFASFSSFSAYRNISYQ